MAGSTFEDETIQRMMEAHRAGVVKFLEWCEEFWKHDTKEQWHNEEPYPHEQFVEGWDRAIHGMRAAFDCYAEEHLG